jgi:hypothetical protein
VRGCALGLVHRRAAPKTGPSPPVRVRVSARAPARPHRQKKTTGQRDGNVCG